MKLTELSKTEFNKIIYIVHFWFLTMMKIQM